MNFLKQETKFVCLTFTFLFQSGRNSANLDFHAAYFLIVSGGKTLKISHVAMLVPLSVWRTGPQSVGLIELWNNDKFQKYDTIVNILLEVVNLERLFLYRRNLARQCLATRESISALQMSKKFMTSFDHFTKVAFSLKSPINPYFNRLS